MNEGQNDVSVEEMTEPSGFAMREAARCWCVPSTAKYTMNADLAIEFARILDRCIAERWTGKEDAPDQKDNPVHVGLTPMPSSGPLTEIAADDPSYVRRKGPCDTIERVDPNVTMSHTDLLEKRIDNLDETIVHLNSRVLDRLDEQEKRQVHHIEAQEARLTNLEKRANLGNERLNTLEQSVPDFKNIMDERLQILHKRIEALDARIEHPRMQIKPDGSVVPFKLVEVSENRIERLEENIMGLKNRVSDILAEQEKRIDSTADLAKTLSANLGKLTVRSFEDIDKEIKALQKTLKGLVNHLGTSFFSHDALDVTKRLDQLESNYSGLQHAIDPGDRT